MSEYRHDKDVDNERNKDGDGRFYKKVFVGFSDAFPIGTIDAPRLF